MGFKQALHRFWESRAGVAADLTPNNWDGIGAHINAALALSDVPLPDVPTAKYARGQRFTYGQDTVVVDMVSVLTKWDVQPGQPLPEHQYRVYINKDVNWLYESELDAVLDELACKMVGR